MMIVAIYINRKANVQKILKRIFKLFMCFLLVLTNFINDKYLLVYAETPGFTTMIFAQGAGTGSDFLSDSWQCSGTLGSAGGSILPAYEPGIVKDKDDGNYLNDDSTVIRLIRGVKATTGNEVQEDDSNSYKVFRTGEAFLKQGFKLDTKASFTAKFTFSMPEAVVNSNQAGGDQFAREVGGDGIAFLMTTEPTHTVNAGSGMGYQGIGNSVAVEFDSYYNGAYCDVSNSADEDRQNWGFDNQLYLHKSGNDGTNDYNNVNPFNASDPYVNYVNPNHAERFDHIAITRNGEIKKYDALYYINGLNPTELEDNKYINLNNRYENSPINPNATSAVQTSNDSNCATRFADAGVNNRLFTAWIDYDGTKMYVYYATGDFANATKPASPQITKDVDLSLFNGQTVYMGFTSAVGVSKANHTIHSFQFVNKFTAFYNVNYYKKPPAGVYELVEKLKKENVEAPINTVVNKETADPDYATAIPNYSFVRADPESITLTEPGKVYDINLYYDPIPASYKVEHYLKEPGKDNYKLKETETFDNNVYVGDTVTANEKEFPNYHYVPRHTNEVKTDTIEERKETVLKLYYDPNTAEYTVEHYLKEPGSDPANYVKKEDATETHAAEIGEKVTATTKGFLNYHYVADHANEVKEGTIKAGETTVLKLYYDPNTTGYKVEYYLKNPNSGDYEHKGEYDENINNADVGATVNATIKDFDRYQHVTVEGQSIETATVAADGSTTLRVYYDPVKTTYKIEYYFKDPNTGEYEHNKPDAPDETVNDVEAGKTVTAPNKIFDGYTKVKTDPESGTATVAADGTTTLKIYYDPVKTTYKVEYFLQTSGDNFERKDDETKEFEAYFGEKVTAEIKTFEGYAHITTENSNEEDTVSADGSTVLKVYYSKSKTTYKIEYYLQNPDGSYRLEKTVPNNETYVGQEITAPIEDFEGYQHVTIPDKSNEKDTAKANDATVLKVYYNILKAPYKVLYYLQNPDGSYRLEETVLGPEAFVGTAVSAPNKTFDGYEKVTILESIETATVVADGSTTLKVYYNISKAPYKVQHYIQKPDGSYELYEEIVINGNSGEKVFAEIIIIDGYEHIIIYESNEEDIVNTDGSTVLKVYYKAKLRKVDTGDYSNILNYIMLSSFYMIFLSTGRFLKRK